MKKPTTIILLAGVALACVAARQVESNRQNHYPDQADNFGFGLKVAATYFGNYIVHFPDDTSSSLLVINTLHADGTLVVAPADMFGNGVPAVSGMRSTFQGSWVPSGQKKILWSGLVFAFDQSGNLGAPVWGNGGLMRISGETTWDKSYQNMWGDGTLEIFLPEQNPLHGTPIATFPITFELERVNAR